MTRISKNSLLALFQVYQQNPTSPSGLRARNRIVEANIPLVKSIIKKFPNNYEHDDLLQEGSIGLIESVTRFNPSKGMFSTYATFWIKNKIYNYIRTKYMKIKFPEKILKLLSKEEYSEEEIKILCKRFECTPDQIPMMQQMAKGTLSVDFNMNDDNEDKFIDFMT